MNIIKMLHMLIAYLQFLPISCDNIRVIIKAIECLLIKTVLWPYLQFPFQRRFVYKFHVRDTEFNNNNSLNHSYFTKGLHLCITPLYYHKEIVFLASMSIKMIRLICHWNKKNYQ